MRVRTGQTTTNSWRHRTGYTPGCSSKSMSSRTRSLSRPTSPMRRWWCAPNAPITRAATASRITPRSARTSSSRSIMLARGHSASHIGSSGGKQANLPLRRRWQPGFAPLSFGCCGCAPLAVCCGRDLSVDPGNREAPIGHELPIEVLHWKGRLRLQKQPFAIINRLH